MNQQHFNAIFTRLTTRRREVLLKVLANQTDKEIAKSLHIAESTVRKHRQEICKEFGLKNEFSDERRSKLPELIALFAKYKPELLSESDSSSHTSNGTDNPVQSVRSHTEDIKLDEILRILQGIQRNEQIIISSVNLISIPPTIDKWQGRNQEIQKLQAWLNDSSVKTIGIHGLSGVGKSWLAGYLYNYADFDSKFWADVRQGTDFTVFAQNALIKLAGISAEQVTKLHEAEQLIFALLEALRKHRCLLVIDNLETLLDQERHFVGTYRGFFNRWVEHGTTSKLLVTTQTIPEVMEGHGCWLPLQGLEATDGGNLLQELGIVGSDEELQDFSKYLNGHPKILRLVASKLKPGTHIREAEKLGFKQLELLLNKVPMSYRERERIFFVWILEQHFENLTSELQQFFLNLSLYRRSFDRDAAAVVLPDTKPVVNLLSWDKLREIPSQEKELQFLKSFDTTKITNLGMVLMNSEGHKAQEPTGNWRVQQALDELTNRSLLDMNQGEESYQFHPLVMQYSKQKTGKQQELLRERVLAYYLSIGSDRSTWQTLEDIAPHLEIVYHLCEMKEYAVALETLRIYKEVLDLRGYYSVQIELYEKLVQSWESRNEEKSDFAAALIDLGILYEHLGKYPQSIKNLQQALVIERNIGDRQGEAAALANLGLNYQNMGNYQTALENFHQQLMIAREIKDDEEEAKALNNLGTVYYWLGQYQKAIDYQQQKLKVLQNECDFQQQAITLGNLGSAYCALGEYQQALECHQQQLEIARKIGYRAIEARALDALGVVHNCLDKYQQAINFLQQSLIITREIGDREAESISVTNLGNTYFFLGQQQNQQAIQHYQQSIKIAQEIGHYHAQANAWTNLGHAFAALQEKSQAMKAFQNAYNIFQAMGLNEYAQRIKKIIEELS
ncbi:MAG: tetratricopeptide repeat protein [Nostocaceae cyanobacterium]|nr:tetratricopeptide repeat protein [Nostocaceae cyanobacterium]